MFTMRLLTRFRHLGSNQIASDGELDKESKHRLDVHHRFCEVDIAILAFQYPSKL